MAVGTMRQTHGERAFSALNIVLLLGLVVITAYPLLYVVFASLSEEEVAVLNSIRRRLDALEDPEVEGHDFKTI